MKNQYSPGNTTDVAAPYAVSSGGGCLVGSLFGIAAYDAANGANVTLYHTGTFTMAKTSAQAWTVGALIYWDDTAKVATNSANAGANKAIGVAVAAAANPSSTGIVRLNGAFIS
jgi:predicted RecA/RadA family phage recombinase